MLQQPVFDHLPREIMRWPNDLIEASVNVKVGIAILFATTGRTFAFVMRVGAKNASAHKLLDATGDSWVLPLHSARDVRF